MEDAATVEISRMQIWQWIRHRARMTGEFDHPGLVAAMLAEEVEQALENIEADQRWQVWPETSSNMAAWVRSSRRS